MSSMARACRGCRLAGLPGRPRIVVLHGDEVGGGVIVQTEVEALLDAAGLAAAIGLEAALAANDPVALAAWFDPAVYGPAARLTWTVRDERDER